MRSLRARGGSVLLAVCVATSVQAASSRGTVGFQFLRSTWTPRPAAMAGAFVAVPGDLAGASCNPAAAAEAPDNTLQASFMNHVLDFASGCLAYSHDLGSLARGQFTVAAMSYGRFNETDLSGLPTGRTFGAGTIVVSETVARRVLAGLLTGVNLKYVHSYIDTYSSQAVVLDAGVVFHTPIQDLDVGAAVQNVGKVLSPFVHIKDRLPLCYRLGWSKRLAHLPLLYSVEAFKYVDDDFQLAIGGEFTVTPQVFLRWGYSTLSRQMKVGTEADQLAGISLGVGFRWRKYHFDYSFSSLGQIGSVNRFGLTAGF